MNSTTTETCEHDSIAFWFLSFAAVNKRLKQINPTISERGFLLESIKWKFCCFLFPKFPSQTAAYSTVMHKFACCGIRTYDPECRRLDFVKCHAFPCVTSFFMTPCDYQFDMGLPLGSTIGCLHSLFKFDLSNLSSTLIIPSSSS